MHFRCPHCGLDMEVPPVSAGKNLKCPQCEELFKLELPKAILLDEETSASAIILEDEVEETLVLSEEAPETVELTEEMEESASDDDPFALGDAKPAPIIKESPRVWYVVVGGVAAVALTFDELKKKAAHGEIRPKSKLYFAPKDLTMPAKDVPGLFASEDAKREKDKAKGKTGRWFRRSAPARQAAPAGNVAQDLGFLTDEATVKPAASAEQAAQQIAAASEVAQAGAAAPAEGAQAEAAADPAAALAEQLASPVKQAVKASSSADDLTAIAAAAEQRNSRPAAKPNAAPATPTEGDTPPVDSKPSSVSDEDRAAALAEALNDIFAPKKKRPKP